jgi:HSP20 family molecular chaperone IbpA
MEGFMAIVKSRRPFTSPFAVGKVPSLPAFEDLENRMRTMFDSPLGTLNTEFFAPPVGWLPPTDITESDLELTLTAELPGLDLKEVEISIQDGMLLLKGEKVEERKEGDEKRYHLFERTYGSFQRAFTLPRSVDASKITAEFAKGVLKVHMPKTPEAQAKTRKVEITAAK